MDEGADDYLTKPFSMPELLARVRAQLRRASEAEPPASHLEVGAFVLDTEAHTAMLAGRELRLTPKEFELLTLLLRNPDRVMTHKVLLRSIWEPASAGQPTTPRVPTQQLRKPVSGASPGWATICTWIEAQGSSKPQLAVPHFSTDFLPPPTLGLGPRLTLKSTFKALSGFVPLYLAATLSAQTPDPQSPPAATDRDAEIRALRQELDRISARLSALEAEGKAPAPIAAAPAPSAAPAAAAKPAATAAPVLTANDAPILSFFRATTLNFDIDGYYGYNFNEPTGGVNLLRAYDVTSNSFNLNQVGVIVERLPTPESRFGGRIDLQFGQATETLQGSSANEQRPQVWRNLFQAYGSYLAPVGSGLQLDFGKFASSLGNEGNYTKDQIAYSRAYSFNFLPFYHTGLRANYTLTPKVNVAYWLVNGANDTEDTNAFKSQAFIFTLKPASTVSWNVNYYFGQEARDFPLTLNPGLPAGPTQPGLPTANISPAPSGREHIFDTYATWQATPKLTLIGEADYVLNRTVPEQQPPRVAIGGFTGKYTLPHDWYVGARAEYFDDRGGLFSGVTQSLKEATAVLDHDFAPGFVVRAEYRRDWSNQRFFLSDTAGALEHAQTTATLGLVYWWGTKQGSW